MAAAATVTVTPLLYRPREAAKALGKSRTAVYEAIYSGALKAKKDGANVVIEHDELLRYAAALPDWERPS